MLRRRSYLVSILVSSIILGMCSSVFMRNPTSSLHLTSPLASSLLVQRKLPQNTKSDISYTVVPITPAFFGYSHQFSYPTLPTESWKAFTTPFSNISILYPPDISVHNIDTSFYSSMSTKPIDEELFVANEYSFTLSMFPFTSPTITDWILSSGNPDGSCQSIANDVHKYLFPCIKYLTSGTVNAYPAIEVSIPPIGNTKSLSDIVVSHDSIVYVFAIGNDSNNANTIFHNILNSMQFQ